MITRRLVRAGLSILLLSLAAALRAQTPTDLPIAALRGGNVWLYDADGNSRQLTVVTGDDRYVEVAWSPDGRMLAFAGLIEGRGEGISLLISSLTGQPSVQLSRGLHPLMPITFRPDSSAVVYALPLADAGTSTADVVEVYAFAPEAGSSYEFLGTLTVVTDCQGYPGPPLPAVYHYHRETGAGESPRYVMAMTPFGLLYSTSCNAPGLWLLRPDSGEAARLFETIDGVFVSPDQTRAVVTRGRSLTFVATEQGPYTEIMPAEDPDQVAFGPTGSGDVYYSTRRIVGETPLTPGARDVIANTYFQMPVDYEVSIRRFNNRTGRDEVLYAAPAFAVGRMAVSADGSALIFSQVPNPGAWAQALANGLVAAGDLDAAAPFSAPQIYALSLHDGTLDQIGQGWETFALNPVAELSLPPARILSPAPPTPAAATATLPPTLTPFPDGFVPPTESPTGFDLGREMIVRAEIGALNVRRRPGTGSPVVQLIYAGDRLTVLGGPEDDLEGYRWWQVRLENGSEGWVAETVNGVLTLRPAEG